MQVKVISDYVGEIQYANGMSLIIDYSTRKRWDHYILYDSRGKQIFCKSVDRLRIRGEASPYNTVLGWSGARP